MPRRTSAGIPVTTPSSRVLHADGPCVAAAVVNLDVRWPRPARGAAAPPIRPRRRRAPPAPGRGRPRRARCVEPVEVEVHERQPPAGVLVDQGEGRAGDHVGVEAEAVGQPFHEHGLAGAQVAVQQHDVAGRQRRPPAPRPTVAACPASHARVGRAARHSAAPPTRSRAISSCSASPMCATMSPAVIDDLAFVGVGQFAGGAVQVDGELAGRARDRAAAPARRRSCR